MKIIYKGTMLYIEKNHLSSTDTFMAKGTTLFQKVVKISILDQQEGKKSKSYSDGDKKRR